MRGASTFRRSSQIFLWAFPFISGALFAFYPFNGWKPHIAVAVGHAVLIGAAVWILGADVVKSGDARQRAVLVAGVLLVAGVVMVSTLFGMGPPPQDPAVYLATRGDQQLRYMALMAAALVVFGGFTILSGAMQDAGDRIFSRIALAAITIGTLLFVLDSLLVYVIVEMLQQKQSSGRTPDWYLAVRAYYLPLHEVAVALIYLATAAYATALRRAGWFGTISSRLFVGISLAAAVLVLLYPVGGKIGAPGFVLGIPAVPYVMPYLMGILLVTRASRLAVEIDTAAERTRRASA